LISSVLRGRSVPIRFISTFSGLGLRSAEVSIGARADPADIAAIISIVAILH
jgi:hypothetical protein